MMCPLIIAISRSIAADDVTAVIRNQRLQLGHGCSVKRYGHVQILPEEAGPKSLFWSTFNLKSTQPLVYLDGGAEVQ